MAKSFNKKKINSKFFSFFEGKSPAEMAALLHVSQSRISEWKSGKKQVPWDKLAYAKELSGKTWDWILGDDQESPQGGDPHVKVHLVRVLDPEPIRSILRLQVALAELGSHVAAGETLSDLPLMRELIDIFQTMKERLENDVRNQEMLNSSDGSDGNVLENRDSLDLPDDSGHSA